MKLIKISILLLLVILLWNVDIYASDELDNLNYMTEDFRPYNYMENGELTGLSVELLKLIWEELNTEPKNIELLPWARAYNMLKNRSNAVLFTTQRTEHRENIFKWVCPIPVNTRNVLIAKRDRKIKLKSIEDAMNFKIGTIRADAAEQILIEMGFHKTMIEPVSVMMNNVKKIDLGRIDLIAINERTFYTYIKDNGISRDAYETLILINETVVCYAFNKEVSDDIINKFQKALDTVIKGPECKKLLNKYDLM